ncbi:MAG: hypothetical protein ACOH2A_06735 [Sphingobacteriaceae bacterium]
MKLAVSKEEIFNGLLRQLESFFPIIKDESVMLLSVMEEVLERCDHCFSKNTNKYYTKDGLVYFSVYHSGQYTIFLYFLSNSIFKKNRFIRLAEKVYYLNKIMNACDLFYEIELPRYFMLDHPVGSVMGRANYGNYFSFGQNCTVGNNKGKFPIIGEHVQMHANSMIIGNTEIGDHVIIGAGTCIKDQNVPSNSLVFGSSPNLIIKPNLKN